MQVPIPIGQDPSAFIGKSVFAGGAGSGGGGPLITVPLLVMSNQFGNGTDTDVGLSIPAAAIPPAGGTFMMETEIVSKTSNGYVTGLLLKWSVTPAAYTNASLMFLLFGASGIAVQTPAVVNNGSTLSGARAFDNAGNLGWACRIVHVFSLSIPSDLKWLVSTNGSGTGNVYPGSFTRLWQFA